MQSVFYVLEDSPIKSIADIAGKTIAVNTLGAHLDYTVREALHGVGLPQNAANLVVVPGPQLEQTLRSSRSTSPRSATGSRPSRARWSSNGGVRGVFDDTDVLGEIAGGFIVLRRDFIEAHPEAARNFVEQSARAADWSRENPDEARKVLAEILDEARRERRAGQILDRLRPARRARRPTTRDLDFWIGVLERDGSLPKGKLKAADMLFDPARRNENQLSADMSRRPAQAAERSRYATSPNPSPSTGARLPC